MKVGHLNKSLWILLLILAPVPAFSQTPGMTIKFDPATASILEVLRHDEPHFSKLIVLIEKSGMKELTTRGQSFTLLAPINDAFNKLPAHSDDSKLPAPTYRSLLEDPMERKQFLSAHLFPGKVLIHTFYDPAPSRYDCKLLEALKGHGDFDTGSFCNPRNPRPAKPSVINGQARVLFADVEGESAVIQVVDRALGWPGVKSN